MTATLTTRYIEATVRRLPVNQQDDVRQELDALIADAVEARISAGETSDEAERAALTELGDPDALASRYADRPMHLIGPRTYFMWLRLLKLMLWTIPPIAAVGGAIAHAVAGADPVTILVEALVLGLSVIVHTAFWTTVVFAVIERTGAELPGGWSVDQLPEGPEGERRWTDAIASLVFLAASAGALVWDAVRGLAYLEGEWTSVLSPTLWPWWMVALGAIMAAEAVFVVRHAVRGRWTVAFAVMRTVLTVLFVSWVATVLGRGTLLSPEVVAALAGIGVGSEVLAILAVLLGGAVALTGTASVVLAWRGQRRDR